MIVRPHDTRRARLAKRTASTLLSASIVLGAKGFAPQRALAQTDAYRCPVTFVVQDNRLPPVGIADIAFDATYDSANLSFAGHGTAVECTNLASGAVATFDDDDARSVGIRLTSETGISSLITPLARCTTLSAGVPAANAVAVTLGAQTQVGGGAITPKVPIDLLMPELEDCELVATTTSTTTSTLPASACADPTDDGSTTATDALLTLNAAVGLTPCALCACDIDGSTTVTASDALIVLNLAVGQPLELDCPACS